MVDARVNGSHSVRLLLDTGADRTLIAPRALAAAGVSLVRGGVKGSIVGVTGPAQAEGVRIDSLEIGEARVGPLLVISYDMNQPGSDGLLGRDFLDRFNVSIDSSRGVVTVSPKR
jgi:predicted aspartyl protease